MAGRILIRHCRTIPANTEQAFNQNRTLDLGGLFACAMENDPRIAEGIGQFRGVARSKMQTGTGKMPKRALSRVWKTASVRIMTNFGKRRVSLLYTF